MPYCKNCGNELPEGAKFCPKCGFAVAMHEDLVMVASAQPVVAPGLKLALWGERFVAWLIDELIFGAVFFVIGVFTFFGGLGFTFIPGWPGWVPFFNPSGIVLFLYWMLMEGSRGQSVGKIAMRLKVVHIDGTPMNMGSAAVESVGKAFLLPLDCILGWILYPRSRLRIFNYVSRTVVVKLD